MKELVIWLRSTVPVFIFSIFLMLTYSVNLSILMGEAGHVDLGYDVVNKIFYFLTAMFIEALILLFVINKKLWVGRWYAFLSLVVNLLYYNHFDFESPRLFITAVVISVLHSGAIFFLAELFYEQSDDEDSTHLMANQCQICGKKFSIEKDLAKHLLKEHKDVLKLKK